MKDKKLKICQVVNNLDAGGLEKVAISLHNGTKHQSFLICLDKYGELYSQVENNKANHLILNKPKNNIFSKFPILNLVRFRRFISSNRIDIIHAHNWAALIYSVTATKGMIRKPKIVFSEHNQINRTTDNEKAKFLNFLQQADARLMVSKNLQMIYKKTYGNHVSTSVMYNGIDGARFNINKIGSPAKSELLPVNDDDFVIGTAVVLSEQKGLKYFIDAAAKVCSTYPNIKFVIAGDGPLRGQLEEQAVQLSLQDNLFFLGYQSEIPKIVSCYDIYLMTSLWEGLPLSLIEALALGKPVIATDVGGNAEVIQQGENGFIVEPQNVSAIRDAIFTLYEDKSKLDIYRNKNVLRFTEEFSLDKMLTAHDDLYQQLSNN